MESGEKAFFRLIGYAHRSGAEPGQLHGGCGNIVFDFGSPCGIRTRPSRFATHCGTDALCSKEEMWNAQYFCLKLSWYWASATGDATLIKATTHFNALFPY
jgi:hypothetical protein